MNEPGFIAVGTSLEEYAKAAYLSVDTNLAPNCYTVTEGKFDEKGNRRSTFKKVIQYGENNFAMVGHTSRSTDPETCARDANILLSVKTQMCDTKKSSHYGKSVRCEFSGLCLYQEYFGMSLAEVKPGLGRGLVITGHARTTYETSGECEPATAFGFVMRLKNNFSVKFLNAFSYALPDENPVSIL